MLDWHFVFRIAMASQYFHSDLVFVAVNEIKRNAVHIWLIQVCVLNWSTYFHSYVCDCQMLPLIEYNTVWYAGQNDLHTRRSSTQTDIYQVSH